MKEEIIYLPEFEALLFELQRVSVEKGKEFVLIAIEVYENELRTYRRIFWESSLPLAPIHKAFKEFYDRIPSTNISKSDQFTAKALLMAAYYKIMIDQEKFNKQTS